MMDPGAPLGSGASRDKLAIERVGREAKRPSSTQSFQEER